MTICFGSGLVVIPNLVRDLGFEFLVLKPRLVGGVLYFICQDILGRGKRCVDAMPQGNANFFMDEISFSLLNSRTIR